MILSPYHNIILCFNYFNANFIQIYIDVFSVYIYSFCSSHGSYTLHGNTGTFRSLLHATAMDTRPKLCEHVDLCVPRKKETKN